MTRASVILAGGGTGGHVYPLLAVADALQALAPEVRLVFVGTARGIEKRVVPARGHELVLVNVLPIRGGGGWAAARGIVRAGAAIPEAWALLRRIEPRAILSIGGYAAGPLTLAARLRRVPLALIEPNARIGLANRLIAPLVARAYTAFADVEPCFPRRSVLRAGVPIRDGFLPRPLVRQTGRLRVLVLGGSQGAEFLNRTLPLALSLVSGDIEVVHQAGPQRELAVRERYQALGLAPVSEVVPLIDDMPARLGAADLVVSRAGASAVAELCAVGRPSLLVPYPYAAADHQLHNARAVEQCGAGICLLQSEATPGRLAQEIERLAGTPGQLERLAERALGMGRPDARFAIAQDVLGLAGLAESGGSGARGRARPSSPGPDIGYRLQEAH